MKTILVLGGTGKTGKRVASRLLEKGLPVRIGSRNAEPSFDWDKPEAWTLALQDVEKVYISFQPDLAVPAAPGKISEFVEKAKEAGVKKLVLLSGRGEKEAQSCERKVSNSGLDYTTIRASWFMQNFSESFLAESILSGHVVLPKIKAKEPFVDADDIADVAVAALTEEGHSKKVYEVTGAELLSFESAIKQISEEIKQDIQFTEVSLNEYVNLLQTYNVPADYIALLSYLFTEVLDGRNEFVSQGVFEALGREPATFKDYCRRVANSGVFTPVS